MGSVGCLKDIAISLDLFFKGLSDCGLLKDYKVQFLERNMLDIASREKFKTVVHEFLANMQKTLQNSLANDELVHCMFIEESDLDGMLSDKTVLLLPDEITVTPQSISEDKLNTQLNLCIDNVVDLEVLGINEVDDGKVEPLDKVLRMMYSNKDKSDIIEPWQVTILENQDVDATIDTITEVMTKNHMRDEGWHCDMCNKIFQKMQNLQEHCREEHNGTGCFECNLCGTRLMTKVSLKRHIRSHSGIKSNTCDICHKSFKRADYLVTHYKLHKGARAHKCSVCEKEFTSKTGLQIHEKLHSDQKDYRCHQCNKSFTRRDKLRDHVLRHLKIRRYQCSTCDKRYAEKRDLRSHLKVHDLVVSHPKF